MAGPTYYKALGTSYFYDSSIALERATTSSVAEPAERLLLMDAVGTWHGPGTREPPGAPAAGAPDHFAFRFDVLLCDLHVKQMPWVQYEHLDDLGYGRDVLNAAARAGQ